MPDAPLAIRQKLEAATKAYLVSRAPSGSYLESVDFRLRQKVTTQKFPRVVIEALRAPAFEDMNELYMVDLRIYLGSHINETGTPDAAEKHAARTGSITEFLADREAFKTFCNDPVASGVSGLLVHDILLEDEEGEQTGQHWIELLAYLVPCQLVSTE
jgi:hypothetical protein